MNCPQCGKKLPVLTRIFEYEKNQTGHYLGKRIVGTKLAVNKYAPFCTLRCGWRWAVNHVKK